MDKLKLFIQIVGCMIPWLLVCSACSSSSTSVSGTPLPITPGKYSQPAEQEITTSYPPPVQFSPTQDPYPAGLPIPTAIPTSWIKEAQAYIDPEGWYSVQIPAAWKADEPGMFSGENGFMETGYLPEMMFMQSPTNICHWIANIETKLIYSIQVPTYLSKKASNCTLTSLPGITPAHVQFIIHNPSADYEHRFFYIKIDTEHFVEVIDTFIWLQPVDISAPKWLVPPEQSLPLRTQDIAFWDTQTGIPSRFSVSEDKVPSAVKDENPFYEVFVHSLPSIVSPDDQTENSVSDSELTIEGLGYDLLGAQHQQQLYRNGELLLENVSDISDVYAFTTTVGLKWAFIVTTAGKMPSGEPDFSRRSRYLVANDQVTDWGFNYHDPPFSPVLNNGELLWVRVSDDFYVQVQNSNQDLLFSFVTYFYTSIPLQRFDTWDNHWVLIIGNYVIQDGEILNEKYGFEEIFNWLLLDGKPFYFFRKGQRVGISYDGMFLPFSYDYVAHGFGYGFYDKNPKKIGDSIQFVGRRDGVWYYVSAEID